MTTEKSLRDDLNDEFDKLTAATDPADVVEEVAEPVIAEVADPVEKPAVEVAEVAEPVTPAVEAPQAWTGPMKEKWATLPPDVQAEINRRENDFHKMVTSRDGDLRLGKDMKDVITPYMPIITAEGGNPVAAVQSLLNTAYQLRTGTPQQKADLVRQIAEQYGVDLGQQAQPQDNYLASLQNEIAQLKQAVNPQVIMSQLQEQQDHVRLRSEIDAFAANPANKHFEQLRPVIKALFEAGQAETLQEAYDMACYANPTIRSTMQQEQLAQDAAKRKAEVNAKKQAAVSVTGSPSSSVGNAKIPDRTTREELEANWAAVHGSKI